MYDIWKRYPERVNAFVFCSTRADPECPSAESMASNMKLIQQLKEEGNNMLAADMSNRLISDKIKQKFPDKLLQVKQWIERNPTKGLCDALYALSTRPNYTPILPSIEVPSLFLCGAEDSLTGPGLMKSLSESVKNSKLTEIRFAGNFCFTHVRLMQPIRTSASI